MLMVFLAASIAAFAASLSAWLALIAIPALVAFSFVGVGAPSPRQHRAARWIGGGLVAGVGLLPILVTFQTIYSETAVRIAGPAGIALSLAGVALLWAAPEMAIPAAIALLAAAGLGRESKTLLFLFGTAGFCATLHLASYKAIRVVPLLVFIALAGTIAGGVVRFLPWAQPWVEAKAGEFLVPAKTARAGLSLTSRLGEIEELGLSPEVALRLWSDRPQYLRARVYKAFNGRVWSRGTEADRRAMVGPRELDADLSRWLEEVPGTTWGAPSAATGGPRIRSRVLLERRPPAGALLAPGGVELARLGANPATIDGAGVLEPWGSSPDLYAVVNRPALPATAPDSECLDVSGVVDARLRTLAEQLKEGASPSERLHRTLSYLETNCRYSLKVGQFLSPDPVGEFVFDKRRGYCEYFASAAALLLRLEGVPARYVVGYSVRPSNLEGGHYVVREADAHAWVEAWIDGQGWVELDPTPAAQFESMRAAIRGGVISGVWQRFKGWISELTAIVKLVGLWTLARRGAMILAGVAALAGAAVLGVRGRRRRRLRSRGPRPAGEGGEGLPPELRELLGRLDRQWRRSGHPRPPSRAPLEHLLGLPEAARSGRGLVEVLYRCLYGGQAPSAEELAGLRRELPG
jgi:transglutaminase-like putative cysteine protease